MILKDWFIKGRKEEMFPEKEIFAQGEHAATLAETLEGADMLIGLIRCQYRDR